MDVSPGGAFVATGGSQDNKIKIWDVKKGDLIREFEVTGNASYTVRVSGRGKYVVTSTSDGSLRAWNVKTGKEAGVISATIGYIYDWAFSRDGKRMAAPSGAKITVWNLDTFKVEHELPGHVGGTSTVAFHPGGRWLASIGSDRKVKVWDLNRGTLIKEFDAIQNGSRIAWTINGQQIVSPGHDNVIRIYGRK